MRKRTQKLASLFLALVLVFSLLPTALASQRCSDFNCPSYITGNNWKPYNNLYHYDTCYAYNHTNLDTHNFVNGRCSQCGYADYSYNYGYGSATSISCSISGCNSTQGYWRYDSSYHYLVCSNGHTQYSGTHTNTGNGYCSCGYNLYNNNYNGNYYNRCTCTSPSLSGTWSYADSSTHYSYCTRCNKPYYAAHTAGVNGYCTGCNTYVGYTNGSGSSACSYYLKSNGWVWQDASQHYQICSHCGTRYTQAHVWGTDGKCTICNASGGYTSSNGYYQLTVPYTTGTFSFTDTSATGGCSVYNLILQDLYAKYGSTNINPSNYYVTFSSYTPTVAALYNYSYSNSYNNNYTSCYLNNLSTLYLQILSQGTWSASYTVTSGSSTVLSGTLSITIGGTGSGANIVYSAAQGEALKLTKADFQTFWKQYIGNSTGALSYVQITSVSGVNGTLCYGHSASEKSHSNASGSTFYVSPTYQQKDLGNLTFVPSKNSTGTATIQFVAYGTSGSYSTLTSVSGSVAITYTKSDVDDITYNAVGNAVLDSSDFTKVYKAAMGSSVSSPSFTIKFLNVPAYGKLYSGYNNYNSYSSYGTELTSANISTYSFSNLSTASDAIDKVVYVPSGTAMTDSVSYAVYSGNTIQYMGKITFYTKELSLNYNSTSSGVSFSAYDFFYGDNALPQNISLSFGTPSSGTLYRNYSSGKGTVVSKSDLFSYNGAVGTYSLNGVTYVPAAGYTGVVEIPFYTGNSSRAAGTVRIYVVAKSFSDVAASDWSATYINRLYASKIVSGTSATTFSPKANVKYGEALKMILRAAGYSEQPESGSHWASGYLSLANRYGIVASTNIDLDSYVNRVTIAEIAAKALKLSKASSIDTGITGPTDTTNGYVYALYNAGIISGDSTSGSNHFYGSQNITRAEIAKIICNIMDYEK